MMMKGTSKLLITIVLFVTTSNAFAQRLGVRAGFNLSNMIVKNDFVDFTKNTTMQAGFHLGMALDAPFNKNFSLETGLLLTTRGYKEEYDIDTVGSATNNVTLLYFNLPITLKGKFEISRNLRLFAVAGPYVGFGLSGKIREHGSQTYFGRTNEIKRTETIRWGNDEKGDNMKRLDYGATFGGGVEFGSFEFGVFYDLGLANIASNTNNGQTIKNRTLKISLAYLFGNPSSGDKGGGGVYQPSRRKR